MAAVTPGSRRHLRETPDDCIRWLNQHPQVYGTTVLVAHHDHSLTVLMATFAPHPDLDGYPTETVRLVVRSDGQVFAIPVDEQQRAWEHRYPGTALEDVVAGRIPGDWNFLLGALCLWYPHDPPHLRWTWTDGLDNLLRIIQRHVWSEEHFRRTRRWPGEDAPHGHRTDGQPHPVRSPELRRTA